MASLNNKVVEFVNKLNEKNPYFVVGGFLFILLIVDYVAILQFQLKALNSLNPKITTLENELKTTKENIQKTPQYRTDIKNFEQQIGKVNDKIKLKDEAPLVLENISRVAAAKGLVINKIVPQTSSSESVLENSDGTYYAIPINVEAKCGYHEFARFVNQLETEEVFMSIPAFNMASGKNDPMTLSVQLLISAIVFEKAKQ